jgi:catechol 2,3-dioxygenase-like lactoylglutathione lyase family enzyme
MSLNHVALTVADRERSATFYGEHFGLTERVHQDEHLLILGEPAAGGGVGEPDPGGGSPGGGAPGGGAPGGGASAASGALLALSTGTPAAADLPRTNHFGFQLESGDEVRAARERFRAAGVEEAEWQDSHGFVRVQVFDPDGYRVEMYTH